jgi:hypothetical protein
MCRAPTIQASVLIIYILVCVLHEELFELDFCHSRSILRACGYPVFILVIALIYSISICDPGIIQNEQSSGIYKPKILEDKKCLRNTPIEIDTGFHCRECNHSVEGFDHHCGVLGVCIAKLNRIKFIAILALGWVGHMILLKISLCKPRLALTIECNNIFLLVTRLQISTAIFYTIRDFYLYGIIWLYAVACLSLFFFTALHIILFFSGSTTLSLIRAVRVSSPCTIPQQLLISTALCCGSTRLARCLVDLHAYLDPSHLLLLARGVRLSRTMRWRLLTTCTLPFVTYALYRILFSSSLGVCLWFSVSVVLMVVATAIMRYIVLNGPADKHGDLVDIREIIQPSLGSIEEEGGVYFCDECQRDWLLQDHHCGAFGVCIHLTNRPLYVAFCLISSTSCAMFLPSSISATNELWEQLPVWRQDPVVYLWSCLDLVWTVVPTLGTLCTVSGLVLILFAFAGQQLAYSLLYSDLQDSYSSEPKLCPRLRVGKMLARVSKIISSHSPIRRTELFFPLRCCIRRTRLTDSKVISSPT